MSERYNAIMAMRPLDRTEPSGNDLTDRIIGILIGFGQKFQDKNGFMDNETVCDAVNEFYELLSDVKENKYDKFIS